MTENTQAPTFSRRLAPEFCHAILATWLWRKRRNEAATGEGATMPQRVLITAGAAGIGREFARAFAATGARVFVCDIDKNALEAIAKEVPGLIARVCDMSRRADIERMVPEAVAGLGGLDVLINNAGISGMTLPVADYP